LLSILSYRSIINNQWILLILLPPGVFKVEPDYDVYIDLKHIPDLYNTRVSKSKHWAPNNIFSLQVSSSSLTVGACVSLSELIAQLRLHQEQSSSYPHLADHLTKIANVPVRNVGSWAGNLMFTHNNNNFPSDVFTIMTAAGATVDLGNAHKPFLYYDILFWYLTYFFSFLWYNCPCDQVTMGLPPTPSQ